MVQTLKRRILSSSGFFGEYGGAYVPDVIRSNVEEVARALARFRREKRFLRELKNAYREVSGRPTPFTPLNNLSRRLGGAQLFLKNEGLNHTGAHKISHCLGQALLAKRMGKKRIIAETGAGQHGVAAATVCARYAMDCVVYMGRKDYERQRPNVFWMEMLGATVVPVSGGTETLNEAVIAAFKDLIAHPDDTHYLLGSAVGPHPYPLMNTFFQKVVGEEIRQQCREATGRLPDYCVACAGGGSNALGMFFDFLDEPRITLIGVEAGGAGAKSGRHAMRIRRGEKGIFEGYYSYFLQDHDGNISPTHSVSAGLDYCGISPILAWLCDIGRVQFSSATDREALRAFQIAAETEGIILALESAHALAHAMRLARRLPRGKIIAVNGSGRGEKDLFITMGHFQRDALRKFLRQTLSSSLNA